EQEVEIVRNALARHDGNRKKVAEELGLSERTLYRWIDKYHLEAKD
ncbi:MAG: helix-turn-helix domain-containing protein, partial [Bacteroidales bacterium]|nr:helix-turn-helix domain-containing protein [Bacteroidales bacterium]